MTFKKLELDFGEVMQRMLEYGEEFTCNKSGKTVYFTEHKYWCGFEPMDKAEFTDRFAKETFSEGLDVSGDSIEF
jgi:hypothetical protein